MNKKALTIKAEKELIRATESTDSWRSVGDPKERKRLWQHIASRTIEGTRKRISLSVNEEDLARLRAEAVRTGVPYQTIINSLIRRHVRSDLVR